jgi:hypothetical protein
MPALTPAPAMKVEHSVILHDNDGAIETAGGAATIKRDQTFGLPDEMNVGH